MRARDERPTNPSEPAAWAVEKATEDLYDVQDPQAVRRRAWQLMREARQLDDERHDQYDDPDQGGEA
jgi:hypothetical protein